ncbi:condensin complex subunit 3 [Micractinium conductrix]|uniref:Condensin complex subunit 3 n=1 Tax=Micractinium conductrix TaxID=554055 RepID=A0A2P6VBJ4_9CHLO|nr:condensin complex subunit 3 [Micractinium conductrix]|eukprot:PSC71431.1 condensin complex subunit 3 [Micractinium conductrix]
MTRGGRGRASAAGLTVAQLLNEVQRGAASAHLRYAKMLWEVATADAEGTLDQLLTAAKWFATVAEPTVYQTRLVNFFGTFANECSSDDRAAFIEALLLPLVELTYAKDATARWRFCQLLHALVGSLPPDVELSDEVATPFEAAMLERLEDSKPNVRATAVRALSRLPDPGPTGDFSECPLVAKMLEMLASETSKAVRKALLATVPCSEFTRKFYVERTRDEADEVRKMAYMTIAQRVPLADMPVDEAALLLRRGLGDRAACVRDNATKLLLTWFTVEHDGEPVRFIHALNVHTHSEECELAVRTLLQTGEVNAVHMGKLAESDGMGLRSAFGEPGVLMGPASALFWRVLCEWLSEQATSKGLSAARKAGAGATIDAAAAAERLEALEAALPPTVSDMADIIAKHATAGAAYRFSTGQLMQLAAKCMDFADAAGRAAASARLHELLTDVPSGEDAEEAAAWEAAWHSEAWLRALALYLRKVYGSPAELADAMLDVLGTLYARGGWAPADGAAPAGAPPAEVAEQAWVHALGVAGLLLEQLPTARPALAARSTFTLRDLLDNLIQPGLRHRSAKVRREAVRCLGLYTFLDGIPTAPASHLLVLRQVLITPGEASAVRTVAAQALGDIAAAHGIREVDRYLIDELAGGLLPGLDPELQQKPLADMLLDVLRQWADDFATLAAEAAGARKKSASRRSRGGEGLEASGALGAAVVEALARLVRCHLRWQERELKEGRELAMDDVDVVKVLIDLVVLYFNPDVEAATLVGQALPVFFQNYAELTDSHQQFVATAFLPAARLAADNDKVSGKKLTAANCTAAKVMGFMAQLLATPYNVDGKQEVVGHEMLLDILLRELLVCANMDTPKPYLVALCRCAAALEVFPVGEAEGGVSARLLLEMTRQALPLLKLDAAMRKDLGALQDRLHVRARQHELSVEPLSPEEIGVLMAQLGQYDVTGTILDDYPLPFDALEEPAAPDAGGGQRGKTPAKAPARGGRRGKAAAQDSDSSEAESDGGPQMPDSSDGEEEGGDHTPARVPPTASRRMPERAARSARKPLVEAASSSSEEEEESDGEEEDDGLSPLAENQSPAVRRPNKARRLSTDSVSALRQALQENRLRAATEGRLEEAERFFQIYLLQEDPSSASAYSNLGNVHQQQERPELAVEDYTRAVELAPEAPVPYLNRAISKETLGVRAAEEGDRLGALALWRSAAADCDAAIERDVAEFAAWFDRGNIRMRLEDWGGALTDFRTAADLAPGLAGYRLREATLLFQQGDATAAQRMMAGIVRKNGNYSEAHAALAAVEWARGEGERAEEQFVRALAQERWWGDMPFIRANTRWPPALYDAMERFLAAPAAGAA